jgi:hypothetical protein
MIIHHLQEFLEWWKFLDRQEEVKLHERFLLKQFISCREMLCRRVTDKFIMPWKFH